jgi:hyperosmotically inducible protein
VRLAVATAIAVAAVALSGCDRAHEDRAAEGVSKAVRNANQALRAAGETAREGAREAGHALGDAAVTARIKTALLADEGVDGASIDVDTSRGLVTLSGNLPNAAQVDRALQVARGTPGVRAVESRLTISTAKSAS